MSSISQRIRPKRFQLSLINPVAIMIELHTGEQLNAQLVNCSTYGIKISYLDSENIIANNVAEGAILPACKLIWDANEHFLGRLVVKHIKKEDEFTNLGCFLIDTKFPLDGKISAFFENPISSDESSLDYELNGDYFNISLFVESEKHNVDILKKCELYRIYMDNWRKTNLFSYARVRMPSKGGRILLKETRSNGRNDYIMMGSNDYLGLASHPKVIEDTCEAVRTYGVGSTGSHVLTGTCQVHEELTEYLAKLYGKESAILFNSGYAANIGSIASLVSFNDLVVMDLLAHASMQDGAIKSPGTFKLFKHNNIESLKSILEKYRSDAFGSIIATEGVFSMDGDLAPLGKIIDVAKKFNSRTFVDEAHSLGVIGKRGLGVCEKDNRTNDIDIIMGNFSKAIGSQGGFICCTKNTKDWLNTFARSRFFSTSLPPAAAQASLTALKLLFDEKFGIEKLRENIRHFVHGVRSLGAPIDEHHESAIIPVIIPDVKKLGLINTKLLDMGICVFPVVYPVVSRSAPRFRFTVSALHSISDLDYVILSLKKAMDETDFKFDQK